MARKTGDKWETDLCGRCGEKHSGLFGKLDVNSVEYIVCPVTNARMNVMNHGYLKDTVFRTTWVKKEKRNGDKKCEQ